MITHLQRELLSLKPLPDGCIGYDCEGRVIMENDVVEVMVDDDVRKLLAGFSFCSVGQRGYAIKEGPCFPIGWSTIVEFEGNQSVACVDYHLRLV